MKRPMIKTKIGNLPAWLNDPEGAREKHRKKYNDMEWAAQQPKGPPKFKIGDVVEFHVGGFGVIDEVSAPDPEDDEEDGWPAEYSTAPIKGMPSRKDGKVAWHYEGDFKRRVAKSPLHSLRRR